MKTFLIGGACAALFVQFTLTAGPPTTGLPLVAHEWGTFTSVQGADGVVQAWNPLVTTELPGFVYDRNRVVPGAQLFGPGSKSERLALQRMETPVIYFYANKEKTVDVTVDFPQGLITEWYPQVQEAGPFAPARDEDNARSQRSFARWQAVRVLPECQGAIPRGLANDSSGSHYYAARETDAAVLLASGKQQPGGEREKFLFYRGIGSFATPLAVSLPGGNEEGISLRNEGQEELGHLLVVRVNGSESKLAEVEKLGSGEQRILDLGPVQTMPLERLAEVVAGKIEEDLTKAGLYPREAAAMVKTWRHSWFAEPGLRVLYSLPRPWTDRTLPLQIEPAPNELVRVMVGRAEVLLPKMEAQLLKQVVRYGDAEPSARAAVVAATREIGLGRFLEPATRRLMAKFPGSEVSARAWELLQAAGHPEKGRLAQR